MNLFGNKKDKDASSSSPVMSEKTKESAGLLKRTTSKIGEILKNKFGSKKAEATAEQMSSSEYLGEIYKMLVENKEQAKLEQDKQISRREEEDSEDQKRHAEIIKALTIRRRPKPKRVIRRERKEEEKAKKAEEKPPTKPEPKTPEKKPETKPETKAPEKKPETKAPEKKPETKAPEKKPETKPPEKKPEPKPETKPPEKKPETKAPEKKPEPKPETKPPEKKPEAKPPEAKPPEKIPEKQPSGAEKGGRKGKTEEVTKPKKETAEKQPPAEKKPSAEPVKQPPKPTQKPTATKAGKEGEGLKGLDAAARQSNIKKSLTGLGASSALSAGIMLVAAKETRAGETLSEEGPVAYKNTWRNMESGKSSIPKDKYDKISAKNPGVPQSGPGAGTAYMNFTFAKKFTGEQWKKMVDDPNEENFFQAVGYKGGSKYKGRSLIGITHEGTYEALGKFLGLDLKNNPELINKDVQTTSAATLAYLALLAGDGLNSKLSVEQMKERYAKGLQILNSYKDPEDLKKALILLTAGKGKVDISNIEQVRAAFSGSSDRAVYLRQQLESGEKTYKSLGLNTGDELNQSSKDNQDMKKQNGQGDQQSNQQYNNVDKGGDSKQVNPVDDRPPFKRK
mgnify:CR=1 FL=1